MSILSQPYFHNEEAAIAKVESVIWPSLISATISGKFLTLSEPTGFWPESWARDLPTGTRHRNAVQACTEIDEHEGPPCFSNA